MGDLAGIAARLDHLAQLGVDALWLSPFYRSPQADGGYDVADYRDVDPLFGTLADFDMLLERAHALGLRVVIDLVPNHTSDQHAWFQAALAAGPGSPERARYMFRDGKANGEEPPNNWGSVFGGPAWTRVDKHPDAARLGATDTQWYLHMFDSSQPDLEWTNPEVRAEMVDILRFWLDKGVDGFRVDVAHGMVKKDGLPDWDGNTSMVDGSTGEAANVTALTPMFDQPGVHEIYREWNTVLAECDGDRALCAEAWVEPLSALARYVRPDEMQQAFNFAYLTTPWDAAALRDVVTTSLGAYDEVGAPTTWVLSNHDVVRHASRLAIPGGGRPNGIRAHEPQPDAVVGLRRARAATLQMLALPGSAYLYQGEELGLPEHTTLDDSLRQDPAWFRSGHTEAGRDGCRVPMPWAGDAPGLGFGPSAATWLPQPDSYRELAADRQRGVDGSTYELYRTALAERRRLGLGAGDLAWVDAFADDPAVVAFRNGDLLVMTNLGGTPVEVPVGYEVLVASGPVDDGVPTDTTVWALPESA
ncbi:glycoside hydrolase family 13 protein [Sanguibacter hominis ATCC BAA-789]|uniref:Glycoside hydrolase family 13 protein n=2 Tax=Sanguibacter TaxID=60919 RepID=A0A9X5FDF2_9MICO|nr:glycoside hydrolase family 13 protein [Sanguibacter hominis ATCC BAA-789]